MISTSIGGKTHLIFNDFLAWKLVDFRRLLNDLEIKMGGICPAAFAEPARSEGRGLFGGRQGRWGLSEGVCVQVHPGDLFFFKFF